MVNNLVKKEATPATKEVTAEDAPAGLEEIDEAEGEAPDKLLRDTIA